MGNIPIAEGHVAEMIRRNRDGFHSGQVFGDRAMDADPSMPATSVSEAIGKLHGAIEAERRSDMQQLLDDPVFLLGAVCGAIDRVRRIPR